MRAVRVRGCKWVDEWARAGRGGWLRGEGEAAAVVGYRRPVVGGVEGQEWGNELATETVIWRPSRNGDVLCHFSSRYCNGCPERHACGLNPVQLLDFRETFIILLLAPVHSLANRPGF